MTLTYEQKVYQWASGHYLSEEVDETFFKLDNDAQFKFLENNAWEPFEDYKGKVVYKIIWQLANDIIMKRVPEEVAK